ncbi:unnamed protein product [Urochloa humidicola]
MAKPPPAVSPGAVERFAGPIASVLAGVVLVWKTVTCPFLKPLRDQLDDLAGRFLRHHARRLLRIADPHLTVTVSEHDDGGGGGGEGMMTRGEAYRQATAYLADRCALRARGLRAVAAPGGGAGDRFVLSLGDGDEVADEFRGATVWWTSVAATANSHHHHDAAAGGGGGGRAYKLVFYRRHRDLIVSSYLPHVCREGRAVMAAGRQRKLFTNDGSVGYWRPAWRHVAFEHPSTFATLAMDPARKKEIMDDLDAFRNGEEYYARVGKAWKRGYLLHGPPGTGKSSMVAAMANHLGYDIYDVELTSVSTNNDLRKLFIETTGKSIIVIEDIDCSLDLTGKRTADSDSDNDNDNEATKKKKKKKKRRRKKVPGHGDGGERKVTLSGVLNFIDGLWSACGGERVVVFTTNHVERLDPALIRSGRMDKHIEMSYCCFESFKFLARNYLAVDDHPLFDDVAALLREVEITPADVAELLTPKRAGGGDDAGSCLAGLVAALRVRDDAKKKAMAKTGGGSQDEEEIVEDDE